ncbi:MAG: hypothetical protein KTR24_08090, partial [Saprospiraceae bacterium]|nr:hypothetical protein [Saprospiraceae bacterium]
MGIGVLKYCQYQLEYISHRIRRLLASHESVKIFNSDFIEAITVINLDRQPRRWKLVKRELGSL